MFSPIFLVDEEGFDGSGAASVETFYEISQILKDFLYRIAHLFTLLADHPGVSRGYVDGKRPKKVEERLVNSCEKARFATRSCESQPDIWAQEQDEADTTDMPLSVIASTLSVAAALLLVATSRSSYRTLPHLIYIDSSKDGR